MLCTARVEARGTAWTPAPTAQVLIDRQLAAAAPAEHGFRVAFVPCPDLWGVTGQGFMTADAGVVLATALVFDGDDVQVRVPVGALCCGRDLDAMHGGMWRSGFGVCSCGCGGHGLSGVFSWCRHDMKSMASKAGANGWMYVTLLRHLRAGVQECGGGWVQAYSGGALARCLPQAPPRRGRAVGLDCDDAHFWVNEEPIPSLRRVATRLPLVLLWRAHRHPKSNASK